MFFVYLQLQQYKQGVIPTNVPAIEDKPKENGQVDVGDQVNNINNKVTYTVLLIQHFHQHIVRLFLFFLWHDHFSFIRCVFFKFTMGFSVSNHINLICM